MADRQFSLSDFDYELPEELIAQFPSTVRGADRLLHLPITPPHDPSRPITPLHDPSRPITPHHDSSRPITPLHDPSRPITPLHDLFFSDLPGLLAPHDLLVINTTRVLHARLLGSRPSGGDAEVLLVHPGRDDTWVAMGRPGSALRPGKHIRLGEGITVETLEVLPDGQRLVRVHGATAAEAMRRFGRLPLPPYIAHAPDAIDEERYQTVYARREGSVAAPTAGLHFTPEVLAVVRARGVAVAELDLEVGPGTFRPVESERLEDHVMHAERYEIPETLPHAVREARRRGGRVWAVGTTVVRALESAADPEGIPVAGASETSIFIRPGYRFRVVDGLVTNFHLPRSTLLMLVSAFAGYDHTMRAYHHAVEQGYRFYSYGDAMAVEREQ